MGSKKLLKRLLEEFISAKEELRRLKRQINEMNDIIDEYFTPKDIVPDDDGSLDTDDFKKGILKELEVVGGHPDAPFEEPIASPYDTLPSDVEPADPEVHG